MGITTTADKKPKSQTFIEDGIWTCPAPDTAVRVIVVGGGANGIIQSGTGINGGPSSFGSLVSANGGSYGTNELGGAGGAKGANASIGTSGAGGAGGVGFLGAGGGGAGSGDVSTSSAKAGGGGGSGYIGYYEGLVSADQTVVVGAGGIGTYPMEFGGDGQRGIVIVEWEG